MPKGKGSTVGGTAKAPAGTTTAPAEEEVAALDSVGTISTDASKAEIVEALVSGATSVIRLPNRGAKQLMSAAQTIDMVGTEVSDLAAKGRKQLIGVSTVDVVRELIIAIVQARASGDILSIVECGVFAVGMGFAVASEFAAEYPNLETPNVFTAFEIAGRTATNGDKGRWVSRSTMNAAAVRILGHVIVECAPAGSFLANFKASAGTMFDPLDDARERTKLMKEANDQLSLADREAINYCRSKLGPYASVISALFGEGGVGLRDIMEGFNQLEAAEF